MKTIKLLTSIILFGIVLTVFDACKGKGEDPGPGEEDTDVAKVTALLTSGTWKINSLTVDGVAKEMFSGLTLSFNVSNSLTATKGDPIWPSTGSWTFTDNTAKAIKLSDQNVVTIESIEENKMTLSLTWSKTTIGPGRVESIAGKHVFVFGK